MFDEPSPGVCELEGPPGFVTLGSGARVNPPGLKFLRSNLIFILCFFVGGSAPGLLAVQVVVGCVCKWSRLLACAAPVDFGYFFAIFAVGLGFGLCSAFFAFSGATDVVTLEAFINNSAAITLRLAFVADCA